MPIVDLRLPIWFDCESQSAIGNWKLAMDMVGEDRVELSPRVPRTRMLALHHTPKENLKLRIADLKFDEVIVKARVKN